jgi:hypothetical protein
MPLKTRENPETGVLEVLLDQTWVNFEEHRRRQIDEAYQNSVRFLRDRLGEDYAQTIRPPEPDGEAAETDAKK